MTDASAAFSDGLPDTMWTLDDPRAGMELNRGSLMRQNWI